MLLPIIRGKKKKRKIKKKSYRQPLSLAQTSSMVGLLEAKRNNEQANSLLKCTWYEQNNYKDVEEAEGVKLES